MYSSRVACRRQEEALRQYFHWQAALGEGTALGRRAMSLIGRFCCKSRLRQATNRDSVVLTRFSMRSIHDGPFEE